MSITNPYYFCYSINLHREIKSNNIYYITKGTNPKSHKDFWVYEKTDTLKQILIKWTKNKVKHIT